METIEGGEDFFICRQTCNKWKLCAEPKYGPSHPESSTQNSRCGAQGTKDLRQEPYSRSPTVHPAGPAAGNTEKQGTASPQTSGRPHPTQTERQDALPGGPRDSPQPDGKTAPPHQQPGPHEPNPPPTGEHSRARPSPPTQVGRRRTAKHGATGTDGDGTSSNYPGGSSP
ncbi:proline-rich proteoglycan 2-like isoform X2 [Entelurus aequoreus]|uniref:proline-rich proteoglycan 2-like isoform X2 n=1 Tax=Entelurus aequoreus TaxID=161455 RepID=UPI002B1D4A49|nr:proline-rich proteoglycan 2-like isoform X2 [Entelurus aequoreus]